MDFLLRPVGSNSSDSTITIDPHAGFTIKSKLESSASSSLLIGTKIFINVCYDGQVPKPNVDFNPSIVYPLIMNNQWEIPIITSSVREDIDKKGTMCYVWDCCINESCMKWINKDLQLREILVEWCIESCELRQSVEISRNHVTFPKLKKKGDKIPPLEMLSHELKQDFRKEVDSIVERSRNDPTSVLEMRRDLLNTEESLDYENDDLPPLFPGEQKAAQRLLIEEIENFDLQIDSDNVQKTVKSIERREPKELKFDVVMGKADDRKEYKMKIEIVSDLNSESDYGVQYGERNNDLIITNLNLESYKDKRLVIPLPDVFKASKPRMETSFIKKDKKFIVYL